MGLESILVGEIEVDQSPALAVPVILNPEMTIGVEV
jgi:hypothetical protein